MQSKKIIFVKSGSFSGTNSNVAKVLEIYFPEYDLEVIDVQTLLLKHNYILLANIFFALKELGLKILRKRKLALKILQSKKLLVAHFLSTSFLFKASTFLISKHLAKRDYVFSFQTMHWFDASKGIIPNFVYIDSTEMAYLYYPNFNRNDLWYSDSRLELEKSVYQNATMIFTMYEKMNRSLIEQYNCEPEKVACVYAGSNVNFENVITDVSKYRAKNILFVGVDWDRKGGPILENAFKKVLQIYPDAQLTVVGCSPNLNLPNCNVVGRIPLAEVFRYYERASIFCLPTRSEPFGIVFAEALSFKLPLVATNIGAIPELIIHGENGYLVDLDNVEQLAMSLIELLGDPGKCQAFGERGYCLGAERYLWEKVGARMRGIIKPIITSGTGL